MHWRQSGKGVGSAVRWQPAVVQEGCQLGPVEVLMLEEAAAKAPMEPAVAVKQQQSQRSQ